MLRKKFGHKVIMAVEKEAALALSMKSDDREAGIIFIRDSDDPLLKFPVF
ncbi:MAG: hypothetical protein HXY48_14635 [Ignavibacteriaceae bacterium]|nr:hypothetical protein [Ignavibacteriaceae bacterium]